jgi:hypothetical protein
MKPPLVPIPSQCGGRAGHWLDCTHRTESVKSEFNASIDIQKSIVQGIFAVMLIRGIKYSGFGLANITGFIPVYSG